MYREYKCGCIVSEFQGRVRVCTTHRPSSGDGIGGMSTTGNLRGKSKKYPANGQMVRWTGK